ncbi:hypothetical protein GQ600_4500 [Phytophthora cactorum]|nr:hypothetical protein GQ600_4500 [Phytophthora cactorum]
MNHRFTIISMKALILPFTKSPTDKTPLLLPAVWTRREPVSGYFRCRCWRVRQQVPRTGYSNLVSHVRSQHPDFEDIMRSVVPVETGTLVPWIRRRSLNLFGWLRWTVMCNLPLHFCENPETRRYSNLDPIGEEQFLEGIACVVQHVKAIMSRSCRPLWFEAGWPHNSEHYLAVFVCYELGGQPRCHFSPWRPWSKHPAKTSLRKAMSTSFGTCCPKTTVNLSKTASTWLKTKLRPVLNQATCWSSTFCIVNRYMKLLEFIQDGDDLAEYLPSPAANRTLRKLLEDLKKIESVSKELQFEVGVNRRRPVLLRCSHRAVARIRYVPRRSPHFKQILFLRMNDALWDANVVNECY